MESENKVKVLEKALDVLECFSYDTQELSLSDLAEATSLSPSTVFRIINTLESRQFLYRNEDKKYSLGVKFAQLGNLGVNTTINTLRNIALPHMSKLRSQIDETISIYIRDGEHRICVARLESTNSLRQVIRVGDRYPLQQGATGKILLAYSKETLQRTILLDAYEEVKPQLDAIKEKGYATSSGERAEGVSAIAAPLFNADKTIMAALSLSGPTARILDTAVEEKIQAVMRCAQEINKEMKL